MNILDIDFNALYKEQKEITTFKPKTKEDWNAKAKDMDSRIHQSIYNEEFLSRVDTKGVRAYWMSDVGPEIWLCGLPKNWKKYTQWITQRRCSAV